MFNVDDGKVINSVTDPAFFGSAESLQVSVNFLSFANSKGINLFKLKHGNINQFYDLEKSQEYLINLTGQSSDLRPQSLYLLSQNEAQKLVLTKLETQHLLKVYQANLDAMAQAQFASSDKLIGFYSEMGDSGSSLRGSRPKYSKIVMLDLDLFEKSGFSFNDETLKTIVREDNYIHRFKYAKIKGEKECEMIMYVMQDCSVKVFKLNGNQRPSIILRPENTDLNQLYSDYFGQRIVSKEETAQKSKQFGNNLRHVKRASIDPNKPSTSIIVPKYCKISTQNSNSHANENHEGESGFYRPNVEYLWLSESNPDFYLCCLSLSVKAKPLKRQFLLVFSIQTLSCFRFP